MGSSALGATLADTENSTVLFLLERLSHVMGPDVSVRLGTLQSAVMDTVQGDAVTLSPVGESLKFKMASERLKSSNGEQVVAETEFLFRVIVRAGTNDSLRDQFLATRRLFRRAIGALACTRRIDGEIRDVLHDTIARWTPINNGREWIAEASFTVGVGEDTKISHSVLNGESNLDRQ